MQLYLGPCHCTVDAPDMEMMADDGRELDNPSSRHHVLIRGPSPDRLTTEAAAPQRHVRSTNTIQETPDPRYGIHRFPCDTAVAVTPVAGEGG